MLEVGEDSPQKKRGMIGLDAKPTSDLTVWIIPRTQEADRLLHLHIDHLFDVTLALRLLRCTFECLVPSLAPAPERNCPTYLTFSPILQSCRLERNEMDTMRKPSGRCLCGKVVVSIDGEHDAQPGACHCRMCQIWTGGVFLGFTAAAEAVSVKGPVKHFQSTLFAERAFCGTCGTHLWIRNTEDRAAAYDLMPGLFDAALDWPLRSEIYTDKAMASICLEGDHPRKTEAEYQAANPHLD